MTTKCYQTNEHSTTPCIRTRAQVATAGARVAPSSMSTHSRAQQSSVLTPSHRQVLFVAAVIRQLRHQRGMVCLTHAASHDWKMKSIKLWQSWMRTQASSLTTDSWWEAQSTEKHGASCLPTNLDNWQTLSNSYTNARYQHSRWKISHTDNLIAWWDQKRQNPINDQLLWCRGHPISGNASGQNTFHQFDINNTTLMKADYYLVS